MTEGWHQTDYLILFALDECLRASQDYQIDKFIPGHRVVGLKSWDNLIVENGAGIALSVPSVPMDLSYSAPYELPTSLTLEPDIRFTGKIKWYVKPVVFGGDPQDPENLTWLTQKQHSQLVVWWNEQYKALRAQSRGGA